MGKYINEVNGRFLGVTFREKCNVLREVGAQEISEPQSFEPNIVCVIDNGHFAAAAYAYNNEELNVFKSFDVRPKKWFIFEGVEQYAN